METQYINLNMTPIGVTPTFHISQYDVGRMLGFIVHSGGATVDLDTYTCTVEATRSDGTAITSAVATTDNIGTFEVTPTMSNKADKYRCQLIIVDENSKRIASLPFDMDVTKAAMDENSEGIEEDASLYQQYTEAVQGAIAEANADIQAEENARIAAVNAEATARQNADATLQNNIDAEATARQSADNTLQGNINSEAATRASADSNLQSQINQIIAPSGEAPSAAEVQNARIGADGVTYSTLGDAIRGNDNKLKNAIDFVSGNIIIPFQKNKEIFLNNTTVSIIPSDSANYDCLVAECVAGDMFTITAYGGGSPRAYGFLDANKNVIICSAENLQLTNTILVAPNGSAYFVVNNRIQYRDVGCVCKGVQSDAGIGMVNDDLKNTIGIQRINMVKGANILLGNSTTDFSYNTDANWECAIVPCSEGQFLTISAKGGMNPRAYAFVKSNGEIIAKAASGETVTNRLVIAPPGTSYCIINNNKTNVAVSYIGNLSVLDDYSPTILNYEIGSIYGGVDIPSTALARTQVMTVFPGDMVYIESGFRARIVYYDFNLRYIKQSDFLTTPTMFTQTSFVRLTAGRNPEATISDSEVQIIRASVFIISNKTAKTIETILPTRQTYYRKRALASNALGGAGKRIPFCDVTNNGVLIVGSDNRFNNTGDLNPIDIGIVRSFDNGQTFTEPQTVLEKTPGGTNYRVMDGAILVDRTNNRVYIFGHRINEDTAWENIHSGDYDGYPVYKYSDDDGATWSEEVSLKSLKTSDMVTLFDGVGKGITMDDGTLVMPMQAKMKTSNTSETGDMFDIQSCIAYSKNHGATWTLSNLLPCYSSECQVVELTAGVLMINTRSCISRRRVFTTDDMGATWTQDASDKTIIEPYACQGCLSKTALFGSNLFTFSNPHSLMARENLMVQYSKDAENWNEGIVVVKGTTAGYSCTAFFNGVFFVTTEEDGTIYLYAFPIEYIMLF